MDLDRALPASFEDERRALEEEERRVLEGRRDGGEEDPALAIFAGDCNMASLYLISPSILLHLEVEIPLGRSLHWLVH